MHIIVAICLKLLFIILLFLVSKIKNKIASYKINLDFWRNLQNSVMADFTKFQMKFVKSNKQRL